VAPLEARRQLTGQDRVLRSKDVEQPPVPPVAPEGRWQRGLARTRRWYAGSVLEEFVVRMGEEDFVNQIMIFGALFLLSALPLVILLNSFAHRRTEDDLTRHLGLDAHAQRVVDGLFTSGHVVFSAVVLALLFAVGGTISVAGAVQRIYERTFHQPHLKRWNVPRLLIWAAVLLAWLATDGVIAAGTRQVTDGIVIDGVAVFGVTTVFFWWSMRFLLARRVQSRRLVVPALVTAAFWMGLEVFSALYFSSSINADSSVYGSIGVVFSLLTWFTAIAAVVILGAVIGDIAQGRLAAKHLRT
jgi:membrane protein